MFFEQIISGLVVGSVYALIGIGFSMIFACTKRITFAHGDLVALGGFVGFVLIKIFPSFLILSFIFCSLIIGIINVIIERLFLRPLQQEGKSLNFVIATIGLSIAMKIVMQMIWGPYPVSYPNIVSEKPFFILNMPIRPLYIIIFLISILLMIMLQYFLLYVKTGRGLRALSQDIYAARLMGINMGQSISIVYFISGALAGIAGMLIAPVYFVSNTMGSFLGLKAFVAALIGGLGSIPGTIAGGLFLGLIENLSSGFISSSYRSGISMLFLVLVLLFFPKGFLSIFRSKYFLKKGKSKNEK